MSVWDSLKEAFVRDSKKFLYLPIADDHVKEPQYQSAPLEEGRNYFRLWLSEMCLKSDREWGKSWHPAVHSLIEFQFGERRLEIPHVAGSNKLKELSADKLDKVIPLNYPMTALMPFNGGVVELTAGLLAMQGDDYVRRFINVLGNFAGLLAVPQLSTALDVIGPVASGIQELVGATNGSLHLGVHQGFTGKSGGGAAKLKGGYFAVILAEVDQVDIGQLWVVNDRLQLGQSMAASAPIKGYTYMLFRIDNLTERDDWAGLANIQEPYKKAFALAREGKMEEADSQLRRAMITAYESDDLVRMDRPRVAQILKKDFDQMKQDLGLGAVPAGEPDLAETMKRAMPVSQMVALGLPKFADLFRSQ